MDSLLLDDDTATDNSATADSAIADGAIADGAIDASLPRAVAASTGADAASGLLHLRRGPGEISEAGGGSERVEGCRREGFDGQGCSGDGAQGLTGLSAFADAGRGAGSVAEMTGARVVGRTTNASDAGPVSSDAGGGSLVSGGLFESGERQGYESRRSGEAVGQAAETEPHTPIASSDSAGLVRSDSPASPAGGSEPRVVVERSARSRGMLGFFGF